MLDRFKGRLFADRLFADPRSTLAFLRRLLTEQARAHWRRYGLVVVLMAVGAACTALPPWLLGRGIDSAYVYSSDSVAFAATAMMVIFALKWVTGYAQSVGMARIANRIVAEYQKRMCNKLLAQDVAFYADRHSSEFAAQITFGAGSARRRVEDAMAKLIKGRTTLVIAHRLHTITHADTIHVVEKGEIVESAATPI
jgi:ABC-type multidrug transport system fused ATPase/permease subunit